MPVDKKRVHEKQGDEIIDRTAPPGEVIYEAVYAEGANMNWGGMHWSSRFQD